ncbi:MAG: hypothetical protein ACO3E0_03165, partial [Candidatus Kapaibacteriota bacterium]
MWRVKWALLIIAAAVGCTSGSERREHVITLWHFWSEPAQELVLDSLLQRFMREHPGVRVDATALA